MMQGKVVVISGASRGIGAAAAQVFAQAGAKVALLARSGDAVQGLALALGGHAMALPCDVADASAVAGAVDAVMARWGRVDVLINNAGVIAPIARYEGFVVRREFVHRFPYLVMFVESDTLRRVIMIRRSDSDPAVWRSRI